MTKPWMEEPSLHLHLLLPLTASVVFVVGLILIKRASAEGVRPWTITFISNMWAALVFAPLLLIGGRAQPWTAAWQPLVIGILYILGQVFTFWALSHGDVSVATPVFSVKLLLVAVFLTVIARNPVSLTIWFAAGIAMVGVVLVQHGASSTPHNHVGRTIIFALAAAIAFALFDVLVQSWGPAWGAGRLLPASFAAAAIFSFGFLPWTDRWMRLPLATLVPLMLGTMCIALQAFCIVFTLAHFGDAARVNIVYALRGLWAVVLAFALARVIGSGEADIATRFFVFRTLGAGMLTGAVVLAILAGS